MVLRFRSLAVAVGIAVSGVVLSACSHLSGKQEPTPDLTTADVLYLKELTDSDFEYKTPTTVGGDIRAGRGVCSSLDTSKSVPITVRGLISNDFNPDHASVIIVAAIRSYCPQHNGLLAVPGRN